MWIADFLPEEGFDKARISIFGTGEYSEPIDSCQVFHSGMRKHRKVRTNGWRAVLLTARALFVLSVT